MVDCGIKDGRTDRISPSLVWRAAQISRMVCPSRCAYWKSMGEMRRIPSVKMSEGVMRSPNASAASRANFERASQPSISALGLASA
jgi:hypothetical protein